MSLFDQKSGNGTTDVSRASGNKEFHKERNFLQRFGLKLSVIHPAKWGRRRTVG
jgi:hypothetical protein